MIVGESLPRRDGGEKIRGAARYIDDINFPGQLLGHTIRSPHACARIRKITYDGAFDWSKVVTFVAEEIPGENVFNNFNMDIPFLPRDGRVNYVGEPVMLLAAGDRETLREAESHINIEYEVLPAALTISEGLSLKSLIYGADNILKHYAINKGDIDEGFRKARHITEGVYRTWHQEQLYIEPQGMIALPDDDGQGVTIHGSLQCPYYVRLESQRLFKFPPEKIRIIQSTTGGGFGGKEHFPSIIAGHAALLSLKARKPVKMIYERREDMEASTKRHPSLIRVKSGLDDEGRLVAMDVDITFDGGAYSMATPVVLARGTIAGCGAYNCPNVRIRSRGVATNTVPTSAFRGFGAPQVFFAIELHMTKAAEVAGLSPLELRNRNLLREGDHTATGQLLRGSVGIGECVEEVVKRTDFDALYEKYRKQPADALKRRGIGISAVFHGAGFTGKGEDRIKARAGLKLLSDGRVKILCGTTEMGQGMRTVLPQIVAETLQQPFEQVEVEKTDTDLVPNSGPTVASRTTMIVGKVLYDLGNAVIEALRKVVSGDRNVDASDIEYRGGVFYNRGEQLADFGAAVSLYLAAGNAPEFYGQYSHPPFIQWDEEKFEGDAYAGYGWAATVAEVEVDLETFEVEVIRLVTAQDMGKAVNPRLVEGQIEGGTLQSIGYCLTEEIKMKEGRILNNSLTTYIIPTLKDCPPIEAHIVESPYSYGPFGAKGVGEMPHVASVGAIAAAVRQAAGVDVDEIPLTPEKLYEAARKGVAQCR